MEQELKRYESGVQAMLELVGGKWRILILHQLITGKNEQANFAELSLALLRRS